MIDATVDPNVNPADLTDPEQHRKIAEGVLNQLGLHPNQAGARNLLDMHFQGPTAHPEVAAITAPLVNPGTDFGNQPSQPSGPGQAGQVILPQGGQITEQDKLMPWEKPHPNLPGPGGKPLATPVKFDTNQPPPKGIEIPAASVRPVQMGNPPIQGTAVGNAPLPAGVTPATPPSAEVASNQPLISSGPPSIPTPAAADRMSQGQGLNQATQHEQELNRLIRTGSGISQIHNPWLRGLATAGDIAEGTMFPAAAALTPGTTSHHNALIQGQEGLINQDLKRAQIEKETRPDELEIWMKQNPGKPIQEYWRQKAAETGVGKTPAERLMNYMTTPVESGGMGLDWATAYERLQKMNLEGKPPTAASQQANVQRVFGDLVKGGFDPKSLNDYDKLMTGISNSSLPQADKDAAYGYLASKTTPAAQQALADKRNIGIMNRNIQNAIDKTTGEMAIVTPTDVMNNPNRYILANTGLKVMTQEGTFRDMDYNINQLNTALHGLKNGFDLATKVQIGAALTDVKPEALNNLLAGAVGASLSEDQWDYLTALSLMKENVLTLRNVQGLGQSSDLVRTQMLRMVPGPGTPSVEFADRQIALIKGLTDRLKTSFPKTGVFVPEFPETPLTQYPPPSPAAPGEPTPVPVHRGPVTPGQAVTPPAETPPGTATPVVGGEPPKETVDRMKIGQYIHNPDGTREWIKQPDGTLKEVK